MPSSAYEKIDIFPNMYSYWLYLMVVGLRQWLFDLTNPEDPIQNILIHALFLRYFWVVRCLLTQVHKYG